MKHIAFFVSPHGFGHAARASALMEALHNSLENVHFHVFTTIPEWFFLDSLSKPFSYIACLTDVGLSQKSPFTEDLPQTIEALAQIYPVADETITKLAEEVTRRKCELVLCDISALGILVGERSRIRTVLIENFLWDFIYEAYLKLEPRFEKYIDYLRSAYERTDLWIQTIPVCRPRPNLVPYNPIARKPKFSRALTRAQLGISDDMKTILVTLGGVPDALHFLSKLATHSEYTFLVPGASAELIQRGSPSHVRLFPMRSGLYHPDLVLASDVVIGKLGYSTFAEVYQAQIPFGFVGRRVFPESEIMAKFVRENMPSIELTEEDFHEGTWLNELELLCSLKKQDQSRQNGADAVAQTILKWI